MKKQRACDVILLKLQLKEITQDKKGFIYPTPSDPFGEKRYTFEELLKEVMKEHECNH